MFFKGCGSCTWKTLADGTPSEVFVQKEVLEKAALDMPHPLQLRKALEQI